MGHSSDQSVAGAAMSEACSYVRRYPKLVHWMQTDDPEAERIIAAMKVRTAVKAWLETQRFQRWQEVLADLIDKADTFVNHGEQAGRLMETYRRHRDSGELSALSPTALAVHRAVFALAIYDGAPVLASLRYIQTVVSAQSVGRIRVSPAAVQKHIDKLVARRLFLGYDRGYRGVYGRAGRISLELSPLASEPDPELVLALALTADQRIALLDYVSESRQRRIKIRERKSDMMAHLMKPYLHQVLADLLDEDISERVVPGSLNGMVFMSNGARLDEDFALALEHKRWCESSHLPPLECSCADPDIELAEDW